MRERRQVLPQLIPNAAKHFQLLLFGALERGRIFEALVQADRCAREMGAGLVRAVANSEDDVERLTAKLGDVLGAMRADLDTDLAHYSDRFRAHGTRLGPGTRDFERLPGIVPQEPFGYLASCGVTGAENQNPLLVIHNLEGGAGVSQRKSSVAEAAPKTCATRKPGVSAGRIPEKVSVADRASVTAGLANEVDEVNQ